MTVFIFSFFLLFSCAKDNDLFLSEIIAKEMQETSIANDSIVKDTIVNDTVINLPPVENNPLVISEYIEGIDKAGNDLPVLPSRPLRVKYVAVNGKATNSGDSENEAWNIEYAFTNAKAGDLVWIKAGEYVNPKLVVGNSGTGENPIYFVGYRNRIDDTNATNGATVTWADYKKQGDDLDHMHMPLLQGDRSLAPKFIQNGQAINLRSKSNIIIRNIQIRNYQDAVNLVDSKNNLFDNIINSDNGYFSDFKQAVYNNDLLGSGILMFRSSNNVIKNSLIANPAFRGIMIAENSDYNTVEYTEVINDKIDDTNPTDYFFVVISEGDQVFSSYNVFANCYGARMNNPNHGGHGFDFNTNTQYNLVKDSKLFNTSFHAHGIFTAYNVVDNLDIQGGGKHVSFQGDFGFLDGTHDNLLVDCSIENAIYGVRFMDTGKEKGHPWDDVTDENAGYNNVIRRFKATNLSVSAIDLFWYQEDGLTFKNTFEDCTFTNIPNLFTVYRPNSDFKIINSSINNVPKLFINKPAFPFELNPNTEFRNSSFDGKSEKPLSTKYVVTGE